MRAVISSRLDGGVVELTDQTRLPDEVVSLRCEDTGTLGQAIASLRVRGAPAIGVAAARGVAAAAVRAAAGGGDAERVRGAAVAAADELRPVRPTAVNLAWACDRMVEAACATTAAAGEDVAEALVAAAEAIATAERDACEAMGAHGADLLTTLYPERASLRVLTHCNTGPLCTGGIGTAFGVVTVLHRRGQLGQLWVDETRPLLQGARITAWEADQLGLPHAVLVDGAAGALIASGQVDAVAVGSDRVAANGDVANKIGTYALAVLAQRHDVPFLAVAPTSTVDLDADGGDRVEVEQRDADEVRLARGGTRLAPAGSPVFNPAFDVTPAELITALVTERGAVPRPTTAALSAHLT